MRSQATHIARCSLRGDRREVAIGYVIDAGRCYSKPRWEFYERDSRSEKLHDHVPKKSGRERCTGL